jgi:hypothetical protein
MANSPVIDAEGGVSAKASRVTGKEFHCAGESIPLANEEGLADDQGAMTYPKLAHTKTKFIFPMGRNSLVK